MILKVDKINFFKSLNKFIVFKLFYFKLENKE